MSLIGPNGSGKTTLIKALVGQRELDAGKLRRGHNVKLGLLSQHADELGVGGARTVLEAAQRSTKLKPNEARALLGRFLFGGEAAEKPLDGLSGGERRRLSLAILVHSGANVLILDEPTNHLDLESREALEAALQAFPGSLLLISHDRALLDAVGSRTVAVEDGTLHSYVGGWPEYVRVREERAEAERTAKRAKPAAAKKPPPPKPAGPSKNQRRRAGELEKAIEAAEAELQALEDELADPTPGTTRARRPSPTTRHRRPSRRCRRCTRSGSRRRLIGRGARDADDQRGCPGAPVAPDARRARRSARTRRRRRRGHGAGRRRPRRRRSSWRLATGLAARSGRRVRRRRCRDVAGGSTVRAAGRGDDVALQGSDASATAILPPDEGNWTLRSALAPGGRVLLAWAARRTRRGVDLSARVAVGGLAGRFDAPQRLGSPIRDVNGARAAVPARRPGRARVDGRRRTLRSPQPAPAGSTSPSSPRRRPPSPRSRRSACERGRRSACSRRRSCGSARAATAPATCGRVCSATRAATDRARRSQLRAGTARLSLGGPDDNLGPPRAAAVVVLEAAAPGGQESSRRSERVHVIRRPALRAPPPLGVTARRRGSAIVFLAHGVAGAPGELRRRGPRLRADSGRYRPRAVRVTRGRGRTRFTLRLRPPRPDSLHWVTVQRQSIDDGRATREVGV